MIRAARAEDIPALVRLNQEVQRFHAKAEPAVYRLSSEDELTDWIENFFAERGAEAFLFEEGERVLGYVAFRHIQYEATPYIHGRTCVYVDQLGVTAGARRRGVGRALMEEVYRYATGLGAQSVELDVRAANPGARAFYEDLGYAPTRLSLRRLIE